MGIDTGRYYSKVGLNCALIIFPSLIVFLFLQKLILIPFSTRITLIKFVLITLPNILGVISLAFGIKAYKEGDKVFSIAVILLSITFMALALWLAFWAFQDLSVLHRFGFLE